MKELFLLLAHFLVVLLKLASPGGVRSVVAESLLLKHQLLTLRRSRKRAPKLTPWDRLLVAFGSAFVRLARISRVGGELLVKRRWVSQTDRDNAVSKRRSRAWPARVRARLRIARACHRQGNDEHDGHCSIP